MIESQLRNGCGTSEHVKLEVRTLDQLRSELTLRALPIAGRQDAGRCPAHDALKLTLQLRAGDRPSFSPSSHLILSKCEYLLEPIGARHETIVTID